MTKPDSDQILPCCPVCQAFLTWPDRQQTEIVCQCGHKWPVMLGILILRQDDDPYAGNQFDLQVAHYLVSQFDQMNFRQL
ncbi:MAG: hypothetical protein RJA81_124, partial [Planctomycetota bacterium]